MIKILLVIGATMFAASLATSSEGGSSRIAIVKADDVRGITTKWTRFFALSSEKGVKVSAGIICNSLQGGNPDYVNWLNGLRDSGMVEFWNHGWDHKRWDVGQGKQIKEFKGSGYAHQKKHFEDAQELMKRALGLTPITFGSPYNAMDADTARVMHENRDVRLFFGYGSKGMPGKVLVPMKLRGESNGTGKPDFEVFKAEYRKKDVSFTALQFHPNAFSDAHFEEYARILDFLIAENWTFLLPAEHLASLDKTAE